MSTCAEGLTRQRGSFRGFVVAWDDGFQVCCTRSRCPSVLTAPDPERLDAAAWAAGWASEHGDYVCPEHGSER